MNGIGRNVPPPPPQESVCLYDTFHRVYFSSIAPSIQPIYDIICFCVCIASNDTKRRFHILLSARGGGGVVFGA